MKIKISIIVLAILLLSVSACAGILAEGRVLLKSSSDESDLNVAISQDSEAEIDVDAMVDVPRVAYDEDDLDDEDLVSGIDDVDTTILLADDGIAYEGNEVIVNENVVTIASAGVYLFSGMMKNGQIVVDNPDAEPVRLILKGVDLTCFSSAPIYVRNAEKTILTLAEGTENVITDGTAYELDENDEPNAAIFSNGDLTINGKGLLTVNANYNNGIESDDDLKIINGTITVTSVNDGIKGKDSVTIKDGFITIAAGGDGMQSDNDVDTGKGNIVIEDGGFIITADKDGIQAENVLDISGGQLIIKTGDGSKNANMNGQLQWRDRNQQAQVTESDVSAKGLKAGSLLSISGGAIEIDSADDALHSDNTIQIDAGTFQLSSGDDGIHADALLLINDGSLNILTSYEGLESASININGGTIHVESSDDGINGSDDTVTAMGPQPGMGGFGGGNSTFVMNEGYVYIDAGGDGVDINGTIAMTGGVLLINGPTETMNSAIDFMGSFDVAGGLIVAVGSVGMAQAPSQTSSQYAIMYNFSFAQAAGTLFHVETQTGEEVVTFTPTKAYQSVVISSPEIINNETYNIYSGGQFAGTLADGLYTDGTYTAGTQVDSLTISNVITTAGTAVDGMMGGRGGMPGGQPGGFAGMPGDMPQRGGMEMDKAAQLAFGILALEGTSEAVTQVQAVDLISLWESYQSLLPEVTLAEETRDEILNQVEDVLTQDQLEAISAFEVQDMMTWMLENEVINFGFRDHRDPQAGNGSFTMILDYLLDYLKEK